MELMVDSFHVTIDPDGIAVRIVRIPAAEGAWAVTCGEGDGFVEEEKLGVVAGLHDLPVPVFVF